MRLLIVGFSTRHVVQSAVKAGHEVFAIDHFCDLDLRSLATDYFQFEELDELLPLIITACEKFHPDGIIPTSGAEILSNLPVPLLGTDPKIAEQFLDKSKTQVFLQKLGCPVPRILTEDEVNSGIPAILKPCIGSGGWRNLLVRNSLDIASFERMFLKVPYILQEKVEGIPASVCCVTDGRRAVAIAVNRQILRGTRDAQFGFAGSITPFVHHRQSEMMILAEWIAGASGCKGIIGVDFMVRDDSVSVIEVNPRFVGTLDTIERAMGLNLVTLHLDALNGILPEERPEPIRFAARRILFSSREMKISCDLSEFKPDVADIPVPPMLFKPETAMISCFGEGDSERIALRLLDNLITSLYLLIE